MSRHVDYCNSVIYGTLLMILNKLLPCCVLSATVTVLVADPQVHKVQGGPKNRTVFER